ncbi:MAG: hypothetical protein WAU47_04885 [Desulfobaccales bacterium]
MCLEFLNSLLSSTFAWAGLALFVLIGATLAVRYLFTPSKNEAADQSGRGFTCPCYAPPVIPTEEKQEKTV